MYEIEQVTLHEQPTAVIRGKVAVADMPAWFGRVFGQVAAAVGRAGATITGPPFARYRMLGAAEFEVEAGFPVQGAFTADAEVEPSTLPAGPAVTTWHVGPYDGLGDAYAALEHWVAGAGAVAAVPPWECYFSEPTGDPATWRTLVVQPYGR